MVASTMVKITNSTRETVTHVCHQNYSGHKNGVYPRRIEAGKAIEFEFENKNGEESSGTTVYRGTNEKGKQFEWMFAWYNKDGADESTYKAYAVIAPDGHFKTVDWNNVRAFLMNSDSFTSVVWNKCATEAKISTQEEGVLYEANMSLHRE